MKIISTILIIACAALIIYPLWGLLNPDSYLHELLEEFPSVHKTSVNQIKLAALIQLVENVILASVFINLTRYIQTPTKSALLNFSACTLMIYPLLAMISNFFMGMALTQHLKQPLLHLELSAHALFYLVMGVALLGINKAQRATFNNQTD